MAIFLPSIALPHHARKQNGRIWLPPAPLSAMKAATSRTEYPFEPHLD